MRQRQYVRTEKSLELHLFKSLLQTKFAVDLFCFVLITHFLFNFQEDEANLSEPLSPTHHRADYGQAIETNKYTISVSVAITIFVAVQVCAFCINYKI